MIMKSIDSLEYYMCKFSLLSPGCRLNTEVALLVDNDLVERGKREEEMRGNERYKMKKRTIHIPCLH